MKKYLFLAIVLILMACYLGCKKDKYERSKELVADYLDSALNDPKSYESVKFDTLASKYYNYTNSEPEGKRIDTTIMAYNSMIDEYKQKADSIPTSYAYQDLRNSNQAVIDVLVHQRDSVIGALEIKNKNYKGALYYTLQHFYRAKNGFGALTMHSSIFEIDSAITRVIGIKQ